MELFSRQCPAIVLSFLALLAPPAWAASAPPARAVAITIDDLPRGLDQGPRDLASLTAMTARLLKPFAEHHIPVTGFVNAGRYEEEEAGLKQVLNQWLDAGALLGNHSYSHPDINSVPLARVTADIIRGEEPLKSVLAAAAGDVPPSRLPIRDAGRCAARCGIPATRGLCGP